MKFQNRIIEYGVMAADQFTAHPDNPKFHPPFQRQVIKDLLGTVGWVDAVKVSAKSGYTLDGHERIWTALENGDSEPIPYLKVDVSEDEEKFILATFDPSGYLAQHDAAQLEALLQDVNSDSAAVQQMLAELAEKSGLHFDGETAEPPEDFKSYDENIETEYCCPKCGYKWSGKPNADSE